MEKKQRSKSLQPICSNGRHQLDTAKIQTAAKISIHTNRKRNQRLNSWNKQTPQRLFSTAKRTAARRGEAYNTKWSDLDLTCRTIRITPEKGSKQRIFHISETLAEKLGSLPRKSERIFAYTSIYQLEKSFRRQRKRLVHKLANPRLLNIHCHTFRHWKATMEYYHTRDIFHVMQFLGHRKIENTLIYVQLANSIFKDHDDHYICKVANNAQEAKQLIELGFEYVTGEYADGGKLFRKRKSPYIDSSSERAVVQV